MENVVTVEFLEPAEKFLGSLCEAAREKIISDIDQVTQGSMDATRFKKIDRSGIWEFRTAWGGMEYRLLAFWDKVKKSWIVVTHGFVKKTQKTPEKEIERAKRWRKTYLKSRKK